jgi:hypothetical protein
MGYDRQQTSEPADPDRPNDLFESVPGAFGAHCRFDEKAIEKDYFWEITKHVSFSYILIVIVIVIIVVIILVAE